MKKWMYKILIMLFAGSVMIACSSDDIIDSGSIVEDGDRPVTLTLSVQDITPTVVESRATDAEEKYLNNLQVFVFNAAGNLKGYTRIDNPSDLAQDGEVDNVKVQTRTGTSYIYAIANYNSSIYKVSLPEGLNSEDAVNGDIQDFTHEDFKKLAYERDEGEINIPSAGFLMSGSANNGNECIIKSNNDGSAYISSPTLESDKIIKLQRVVSKVKFNISVAPGKTFKPTRYDIINIPLSGNLVKGSTVNGVTYENITDLHFSTNASNNFEVYLPENIQQVKADAKINKWDDREENSYTSGKKSFTNAPDNGTYVIIYGIYQDEEGKIEGDVNYTVHLGNFSTTTGSLSNFNNERNYRYTYNIQVVDVDKIIAEAEANTQEDWQPGAEGFIINYNAGESFRFDSHYESCVMRFTQKEILDMKQYNAGTEAAGAKKGYICQITTHQGQTDAVMITDALMTEDQKNGVDIDWIEFYKGAKSGAPLTYTETNDATGYKIDELLMHLYDIADDDSKWDVVDDERCLDFTCFVSENYYEDLPWKDYVNVDPRTFSIANEVNVSPDGKSVYATVKYNVSQYSIQTFYNKDKSNLVAFGCETINDEAINNRGAGMTATNNVGNSEPETGGADGYDWHGRALTIKDMRWAGDNNYDWPYVESLQKFHLACMARNRDLDKDGKVDGDEIRWYTPSLPQLTGLWIGEEAIIREARLFNTSLEDIIFRKNTINVIQGNVTGTVQGGLQNHMHYYTSTNPQRVFWAEEGMAYGTIGTDETINYIRCVRTLKDNDLGVADVPDTYYRLSSGEIDLGNVANTALRTSMNEQGELNRHTERDENALNRPRVKFMVADDGVTNTTAAVGKSELVTINGKSYAYYNLETIQTSTGSESPCYYYKENTESYGSWRIPNQREFALMVLSGALGNDDDAPYYSCRTGYSGNHRFGYRYAGNNVQMIELNKLSFPNHYFPEYMGYNQYNGNNGEEDRFRVRCVRDTN